MAKKNKTILLNLQCTVCGHKGYLTPKNVQENKEKLALKKFCSKCREHQDFKEVKISKAKK